MMNFKLKADGFHKGPLWASNSIGHGEYHLPWEVNPDNSELDWILHSYLPMSKEINKSLQEN